MTDQEGLPANIIYNLPSQMLQDRHRLLIDGSTCGVCLQGFQLRQTVRTLPCRHAFHILCIDNWLMNHSQCPVDGSYAGSIARATSVTRKHPNGQLSVTLGTGRGSVGTISSHNLDGVSKRLGHHPKIHHQTHNERNELTGTLPSSFALSGSALLAQNSNKVR